MAEVKAQDLTERQQVLDNDIILITDNNSQEDLKKIKAKNFLESVKFGNLVDLESQGKALTTDAAGNFKGVDIPVNTVIREVFDNGQPYLLEPEVGAVIVRVDGVTIDMPNPTKGDEGREVTFVVTGKGLVFTGEPISELYNNVVVSDLDNAQFAQNITSLRVKTYNGSWVMVAYSVGGEGQYYEVSSVNTTVYSTSPREGVINIISVDSLLFPDPESVQGKEYIVNFSEHFSFIDPGHQPQKIYYNGNPIGETVSLGENCNGFTIKSIKEYANGWRWSVISINTDAKKPNRNTAESVAPFLWFGEKVYMKTIDCGALGDSSNPKTVSHSIEGVKHFIRSEGIAWKSGAGADHITLPMNLLRYVLDGTNIKFTFSINLTGYINSYITLYYTKY